MSKSRTNGTGDSRRESGSAAVLDKPEGTRRAFIAAAAGVDTSVLRDALRARGLVPYELDEPGGEGRSVSDLVEECVSRADLVVAVIDNPRPDSAGDPLVLFEVGYAAARKKRILALVAPGVDLALSNIFKLNIRPENREAIDFGLDQILHAPSGRQGAERPRLETRPIGRVADDLLAELHTEESELEDVVRRALEAAGVKTLAHGPEIDFAVWSNDFEPWIGNPLAVDVKGAIDDPKELEQARAQFGHFLEKTHTQWGLLICRSLPADGGASSNGATRVLVLSAEQLLESMRGVALGPLLAAWRRQHLHGRG